MSQNHGMELKAPDVDEAMSAFFAKLKKRDFYGIVEFHFMEGHVVRVKKTESFEPKEFSRLLTE